MINVFLVSQIFLLFILIIWLGFMEYWFSSNNEDYTYIFEGVDNYYLFSFKASLSYLLLFNSLIPLSLVIILEFGKLGHTIFIEFDATMYDLDTGKGCSCLNFTLHEDLGLIKYIFADKTGTLTKNNMKFMNAYIVERGIFEIK
jgi:P-type E1-E2 ATPase